MRFQTEIELFAREREAAEANLDQLRSRMLSLYPQVQAISTVRTSFEEEITDAEQRTFSVLNRVLEFRVRAIGEMQPGW